MEKFDRQANGMWLKSYQTETGQVDTRAGKIWCDVSTRTNPESAFVKKYPKYANSRNLFPNFQEFAEWCQPQVGYMNVEGSGKYWQLDKDIITPYNQNYTIEDCAFVPNELNKLLNFRHERGGRFLIGVSNPGRNTKFQGRLNYNEKQLYLGLYHTQIEAHRAWQKAKIDCIIDSAKKYRGSVDERVIEGLYLHAKLIEEDYKQGTETKRA